MNPIARIGIILLFVCSLARGGETNALKTKIVSVSLFKNGLGFVQREAALPKGESRLLIAALPVPAHGTFWVYSPDKDATIQELVAFERETSDKLDAISVAELIEANVGQMVDVRLSEKETIRGKIVSVASNRTELPPSARARSSFVPGYVPPTETATLVLLQTGSGTVALNKNTVQMITGVDGPLKAGIERKKRSAALRLHAKSGDGKGRAFILYLAKGITWAPSCVIDITDPKTARVTAKAVILNEIEDLDGVTVNFVTGYPNLQFADVTDPMAMIGDVAAFLNNLLNPPQADPNRGRRGVVMQQAVMSNAAFFQEEIFPAYPNQPLEGQTREELFFYEQKGVALKRGERGYYPLYTIDAPYEHVYEWKIDDVLDEQERYRRDDQRGPQSPEEVWHSIRLSNTSKMPWTTAPAMTMQDGQMLGQDLIYYASPGGKTTVRITQAVDVKAEQAEYEVERQRNAANFYGYSYDLVTVRGELKATNFKDKEITLTITKNLSGEVLKSTPEAKVQQLAKGLKKVNPHCQLTWELPIKERNKLAVEYGYKVYVRN